MTHYKYIGLIQEGDFSARRQKDAPGTERYSILYNMALKDGDRVNLVHLVGKNFSYRKSPESSEIVSAVGIPLEKLLEAIEETKQDFPRPNIFYPVKFIE